MPRPVYIENNVHQRHKKLWTEKKEGEQIALYPAADENDEARFIVDELRKLKAAGRAYHEAAILYRTNAQSRSVEEALLKANIPYLIIGGLKFYARKEIKDVLAYLRFLANPRDRIALERLIDEPKRGIGYDLGSVGGSGSSGRDRLSSDYSTSAFRGIAPGEKTQEY